MACLLPLVAGACLLQTDLIQVSADASRQAAGDFQYHSGARQYGGGTLGRVRVTAGGDLTRHITLYYGYEHSSLLDTRSDRGEERVIAGFSWRPFAPAVR